MRDGGRPERIESIAKAVDWPSRRNGRVDGSTALRFPLPTTDPGRGIRVGQHENSSFCWLGSSRVATMWPPTGIPLGQRKKNLSAVLFDRFSGFVVQRERERERERNGGRSMLSVIVFSCCRFFFVGKFGPTVSTSGSRFRLAARRADEAAIRQRHATTICARQ